MEEKPSKIHSIMIEHFYMIIWKDHFMKTKSALNIFTLTITSVIYFNIYLDDWHFKLSTRQIWILPSKATAIKWCFFFSYTMFGKFCCPTLMWKGSFYSCMTLTFEPGRLIKTLIDVSIRLRPTWAICTLPNLVTKSLLNSLVYWWF